MSLAPSFESLEKLQLVERNAEMLTVYFSAVVVGLGVTVALGVAFLETRRETRVRREHALSAELARQRAIIADYERTIEAYRLYAQNDPELALATL